MRYNPNGRPGVSSIVGSIFFVLIMIVAIASLVSIFNSFSSYNNALGKVNNAKVQQSATQLSITASTFGAFPPSTTSNFNVAAACSATATATTNQNKLFFAAGMWWDFFTCNSNFQYSTSFDGVTWQAATTIPNLVTGYTVGPYFDIQVAGSTLFLVIARLSSAHFQFGEATLAAGGTNAAPAGTISWTEAPAEVTTSANAFGPIQIEADGAGNDWVAVVQGTCTTATNCAIAVYEHEACGTAANTGWEPNACSSATAPTNYAPTASPNFGALSANANMILFTPPSTLSSTGAILLYETGSATLSSTGTIGVISQTALASTAWTQLTTTGITAYYLGSSSALFIGNTMYVAGLESTVVNVGATSGNLYFWTLPFTSITAATATTEVPIESASHAWEAALASTGTTLALFDSYPTSATIQYYTSSTLGSIWSSPAIALESAETSVNGLTPAAGAYAVTWSNTANNVRFAALSTITVANNSPFGVHVVDLYVQETANNILRAHYYSNSTNQFDYWIGQGSTTTIPVRFIWVASTSYLFTVGTDTGVTAQFTASSLPVSSNGCPTGTFLTQTTPLSTCASTAATTPQVISGAGTNTCTDTTSGTALMMGLGLSYTTLAASSGNIYLSFAFQVTSPATSAITSTWRLFYGTGTAPACNAPAAGTALGQSYTVDSQATLARGLSQSASTTITGLFPSTTYWFDVQATDSSTGAWIYSNPDMGITDVLTTSSPNLTTSTNTNTCTDSTSGTAKMMGFGTTFTTGGTGFTGNVFSKLTFNVANAAKSGVNSKYTVTYGTGTAPACNAATSGTTVGNQYTVASQANVLGGAGAKAGFVLTGLAASTTYWVDVQALDSSTDTWTYSNPILAVMEMPTPTALLPNVAGNVNTNTCTDVTVAIYVMAGFATKYTVPSSATGDLYLTLTFQVSIPNKSPTNTQWQVLYGHGVPPTCNAFTAGTAIGNVYTVTSQANVVGGIPQSETFVLPGVEKVAGTTIWVDIQALDSTNDPWIFSNPALSVVTFPG